MRDENVRGISLRAIIGESLSCEEMRRFKCVMSSFDGVCEYSLPTVRILSGERLLCLRLVFPSDMSGESASAFSKTAAKMLENELGCKVKIKLRHKNCC